MKKTWLSLISLGLLASLTFAGCSKSNNVSTDNGGPASGAQCSGAGDEGCGVGSVCVLGQCRHGCTNDAECPQGSICVGDRPPYGCTTEEESACTSNEDCPTGLDCGIDGKCRHACELDEDCPRNEHHCIGFTCVSDAENDFEQWICDTVYDRPEWERRVYYRDGTTYSCNVGTPGNGFLDTCNDGQLVGFATVVSAVEVSSSSIVGSLSEEFPACAQPDCASGIHVCPAELPCDGNEMCEACGDSARFSEPFACRPSQNSVLGACTCLDTALVLDCAGSEAIPQDAALPPGVRSAAFLQLVMREVEDCQLKIPDAIHYTGNDAYWPLAGDQALVVSDQGPLVPGVDYELVDGLITFGAEACSHTHLTTYVCKGSCEPPFADSPGTCSDIQEI